MSGHSKWATTHRQKEAADAKRGAIFTKFANIITAAARENGGNPEANFKLRLAIEKARAANMPNDNIERAIKRGTGELAGSKLEEVVYEALLPGGAALIMEVLTDNRNRTIAEIKKLLTNHGAKFGETGSLAWQFNKAGVLRLAIADNTRLASALTDENQRQEIELALIDGGIEDFLWEEEGLTLYTKPENLNQAKDFLETAAWKIAEAGVELVAKNRVSVIDQGERQKIEELLEALDDNPEVSNYYINADF